MVQRTTTTPPQLITLKSGFVQQVQGLVVLQFTLITPQFCGEASTHVVQFGLYTHVYDFILYLAKRYQYQNLQCVISGQYIDLALFPGSPGMQIVYLWRAWYLFSRDHDVIEIGPEFLEQKGNVLHVIQSTLRLTLSV